MSPRSKCRGCTSLCVGCTPKDEHDYAFEGCEPWCTEDHCETTCKCKACPSCRNQCTPKDGSDYTYTSCEGWCKSAAYHCPFCKCKGCDFCAQSCQSWCTTYVENEAHLADQQGLHG